MKKAKGLSDKSLLDKYRNTKSPAFGSLVKKAVTGSTSQSKPATTKSSVKKKK